MGNSLTLTRAVYVNEYVSVLRKIGAPVDKRLDESSLPSNIEEMPQFFVSTPAAINWVAKTGHEINRSITEHTSYGFVSHYTAIGDYYSFFLSGKQGVRPFFTRTVSTHFETELRTGYCQKFG